ncbi:MAG: glycosyltransferase family 9 protein [Candidatus Omnitrophica bacterium]|nr:glycosyltransferase family 9 protein [Candidatus Omnitrophota bacterium]MBU2044800.1 glycosyltransferase family 9 protein [Candidatus Omnitrophota bacterium]MBU2251628.1 glycosyltransferase family 9 protein [Candidatus Omnitrophota bacterium]MBU2265903.1 glycosyltransferase family 9 protein [Candidatus Omnitrophota bacterium]
MSKNKSFLIINPFGIGDVLFSTPLIRNIKEKLPGSKVFYLCNQRSYPVLKDNPLIEKCFIYERDEFEAIRKQSRIAWIKKFLEFVSDIRREKVDTVLDLSLNSQFGFLSFIAGIKERVGYDYKRRGRFLTKRIKFSGYKDKHVIEYYLDLLRIINIEPRHKKIELFLDSDQKEIANRDKLKIIMVPGGGASWGGQAYRKHWDKAGFAQLADRLIEELGAKVIISGSDQEKGIVDEVASLMCNRPDKAVDMELSKFLNLLNNAELLIANDGGPIHMAVGLGLKTVSIFGPVDEKVYGPYPLDDSRHIVIKKDISCRPCYINFKLPECMHDIMCLKDIDVDEVFKAAEKLLAGKDK